MNQTTESIHGHEIIHLVAGASPTYTRQTLAIEVTKRFGPDARFHTCSAEGMNLDQLLQFLGERGKVVEVNGHLQSDHGQACNHE